MATIDEIAKRAKVSKTTVSFVINSKPGVSPETAAHVRRVMAEMNYVPSALAQRFASRKSMAVALVTQPYPRVFRDAYHAELLDSIHNTLDECNYSLILATANERFIEEKRFLRLLRSGQVDGLLVLEPTYDQEYLCELAKDGEPAVIVNSDGSQYGLDCVRSNDFMVGKLAAEHLLDLGHRKIGFIAGSPNHSSAQDRMTGFRETLAEAGASITEERIFHGDYGASEWCGRNGCREILTRQSEVTALFCCNDTMALGALSQAFEMGRVVPETLSIIGVDDNPTSSCCRPQLTTIRPDSHEIGKQATLVLLDRLNNESHKDKEAVMHLLEPTLVVRQSCAPPRVDPAK